MPKITKLNKINKTRILLRTKTINPKMIRIIKVTILSN